MSRAYLACLPLLFITAVGCTEPESAKPEKPRRSLFSAEGRLPLNPAAEAKCGAPSRNNPLIMEGAPPPPMDYEPEALPPSKGGVVYNAAIARSLALTYINAIYDADLRHDVSPPLRARLERGIWYVSGPPLPKDTIGGEFYLQICQNNGRLLNYLGTQ